MLSFTRALLCPLTLFLRRHAFYDPNDRTLIELQVYFDGRIASNLRCLCKSLDCRAILSKCNNSLVLWKRRKSTMFILLQTLESRLSLQQFVKILSDWHNRPQLRYNLARLQQNCKFSTIVTHLVMVVSLICGVAAESTGCLRICGSRT